MEQLSRTGMYFRYMRIRPGWRTSTGLPKVGAIRRRRQSQKKRIFRDALKKVVLFSGCRIEPTAESKQSDVWVLNPKALPAFIANSQKRLSGEDVRLVAFHLSRFVRASD
jgi:hypothetical protein